MAKGLAGRTAGRTGESTVERTVTRTDDGTEEVSLREAEAYENMERIRSELGDDEGYVLLSRRMQNGQLATLAKINASIFDVDYIIKKFGGGTYSARFYKSGVAIDDGGFLGSVPFIIDPSVQPEPEALPTALVARTDGAPTWLAATLDKMGEAIKALADRKPEPPPPAPDPMAMIEKLAVTMRALTPPERPLPPAQSLRDQLETIKSVVEVGTSIVDARGGGGGDDSGDAYMRVVEKLADPVIALVSDAAKRGQLGRAPNRPALPPPRNAVTPIAPPATAPAAGASPVAWYQEFQRWIPMMVKRAAANKSAEDTAFFILDELSEATLHRLAELAALPDFAEQVGSVLPADLKPYPEWVGEFLQAVQDYLFSDDAGTVEDEDGTAPPGGGGVIDLPAEAARRLAKLDDKPPETPKAGEKEKPEPAPV